MRWAGLGMDPTQALKPTLILYDADIPKQEALIVDLGQEPKLAIARSLRPAQLPLEVLEYLSERGYPDAQAVHTAEESLIFALPVELRRDLKAAGRT